MSGTNWGVAGPIERGWYRAHNVIGRATLHLGDDSQAVQLQQIEGYTGEIRSKVQRQQRFGLSTMPLAGSKGVILYQSGHRGFPTIIADEDPRYRPTGLNGGECQLYMVDGAAKDGTGGKTRVVLQGLLGWVAKLFGVTILIGDSNTQNITITGSGLIKLAGNIEITGTLKVDGATTVQDINIQGNESGGGST
jgi:phage baseplate assembly protein V